MVIISSELECRENDFQSHFIYTKILQSVLLADLSSFLFAKSCCRRLDTNGLVLVEN